LADPRADAFRLAGLSKNYAMRPRLDATDARNGDVESEKDRTAVSSSLQLIRQHQPRWNIQHV
jgi:hypothetical protein